MAGAFGVKGELRISAYTDDPAALLAFRRLRRADDTPALTLTGGRVQKSALIARAEEVPSREAAEALRGLELYIPRQALPALDEDEFYLADLIGMTAVSPEGERLGTVKSVRDFGAGDLLEIQPESGASWWLAFTRETVPEVRLSAGELLVVRPPETSEREL